MSKTRSTYNKWQSAKLPANKRLLTGVDHGKPIIVPPENFSAPNQRNESWGQYADIFFRFNSEAFNALAITPEIISDHDGTTVRLIPGDRTGAVPLRSGLTGQVNGGLVIRPRFGWAGVGNILGEIGWQAMPEFLELPLVPGSAREVPSWVLAGPVLSRLEALLKSLNPGFHLTEEILSKPRGKILWSRYITGPLAQGYWHHLPCSYPELNADTMLRRHIKWTLDRIHRDLLLVGGNDPLALTLASLAIHLLEFLNDVDPLVPRKGELERYKISSRIMNNALLKGIEAISWIVDERGLGGGNERDGLAWVLPLEQLWESYVTSIYRKEASLTGGEVKIGRLGETVFPLVWSDHTHRSLSHLTPDMVIKHNNSIQVIDAKYKAHLAEIDEMGWYQLEQEIKDTHRADLHQILAYASLYDAEEIVATLVYPLRQSTYLSLLERKKDRSYADLYHGGRHIKLELRGLPFGSIYN